MENLLNSEIEDIKLEYEQHRLKILNEQKEDQERKYVKNLYFTILFMIESFSKKYLNDRYHHLCIRGLHDIKHDNVETINNKIYMALFMFQYQIIMYKNTTTDARMIEYCTAIENSKYIELITVMINQTPTLL